MFKLNNSQHSAFSESEQLNEPQLSTNATGGIRPKTGAAVIGASIYVRGDVSGDEDLIIQGHIEGTCSFPKNSVTVGGDGRVKANLEALNITVEGQVTGDLHGSEKVAIKRSGRVEGNIVAPRVVMEDGCHFKGSVEMNAERSKPLSRDKDKAPVVRKKNGDAGSEQADILTRASSAD